MATKIEDAIYCLRMDSCAKCIGYDECIEETGTGRCFQAALMGADALEKQIPRKPIDTGWLFCGECGLDLIINRDVYDGRRIKYCPICGQAIDWEGVKK